MSLTATAKGFLAAWVHTFPEGTTAFIARPFSNGHVGNVIHLTSTGLARSNGRPQIATMGDEITIATTALKPSDETLVRFENKSLSKLESNQQPMFINKSRIEPWKIKNLQGNSEVVDINSPTDRPVVYAFWALWCSACLEELPKLSSFWVKEKPNAHLKFVNLDEGDSSATAKAWLKKNKIQGMHYFDPEGSAYQTFGFSTLPTVVVYQKGKLALKLEGPNPDVLMSALGKKIL